jgi:hypothetical protein
MTVIALISKLEHCLRHKEAMEARGYTVRLLGGNPRRVPHCVDGLVLRIRSCSHAASGVGYAWKRANPTKPFIKEDGMTGIMRALETLIPLPPIKEKPMPTAKTAPTVIEVGTIPGTLRTGRAKDAKVHNVLCAVAAGRRTKAEMRAFWLEHGFDTNMNYLNDALREAKVRNAVINMRKRGEGPGWYARPEEGATPPPVERTPRKPYKKKKKATPPPLADLDATTSSNTRARAREAIVPELPGVESIKDEVQLLVMWLREWNVASIHIDANGEVLLSNPPEKDTDFKVRFKLRK